MATSESSFEQPPSAPERSEELINLPIDLTDIEVDPEDFKRTLIARRREIIEEIERIYDKSVASVPGYNDTVMPGLGVAVLTRSAGKKWEKVIERPAYWSNKTGGIFREMNDLLPKYHPYWIAVQESGFVPEARFLAGSHSYDSAHLFAKIRPS